MIVRLSHIKMKPNYGDYVFEQVDSTQGTGTKQ